MRHPFDGLRAPAGGAKAAPTGETRRSVLGKMVFATAGLLGLGSVASAQRVTTLTRGEEGGGVATTNALGEEGGVTRALNEQGGIPALTTEPFGEEAGKVTSLPVPGLEDGAAAGGPTTQALREEGGGPSRALGEEGGLTTKALNEEGAVTGVWKEAGAGALTVQVKPESKDLTDKQMASAWADMAAADKVKAVQGCAILYGAKKAVPFLKDHLTYKTPEVDEKRLAKLIADLDSDSYQVREKAEADLKAMGQAAVPALEKAMKDSASTEVRMRVKRLLDKAKEGSPQAQAKRGLEVLVALRTKEARELLETLTKGGEKEWMTGAAKKALERTPKPN